MNKRTVLRREGVVQEVELLFGQLEDALLMRGILSKSNQYVFQIVFEKLRAICVRFKTDIFAVVTINRQLITYIPFTEFAFL